MNANILLFCAFIRVFFLNVFQQCCPVKTGMAGWSTKTRFYSNTVAFGDDHI